MRRTVEIVWVEDNLKSAIYKKRKDKVIEKLASKGYQGKIKNAKNLDEAQKLLNDNKNRIDFFISDYNLGTGDTGLDFLIKVREKRKYKQFFILYSNNDYNEILSDVIKKLNKTRIELFCNFIFISLAEVRAKVDEEFDDAIDISLSRWDELNAIRGLYMCEHAEIEFKLERKLEQRNYQTSNLTYKEMYNKFKNSYLSPTLKNKYRGLLEHWKNLIDNRNMLAHTSEKFDNEKGYYLHSNENGKKLEIYEDELDEIRKKLKSDMDEIVKLIDNCS